MSGILYDISKMGLYEVLFSYGIYALRNEPSFYSEICHVRRKIISASLELAFVHTFKKSVPIKSIKS